MIDYIMEKGVLEQGIFRKSGNKAHYEVSFLVSKQIWRTNSLVCSIQKLKEDLTRMSRTNQIASQDQVFALFDQYSVHDIASLLKNFVQNLAKPLLTDELIDYFLKVPGECIWIARVRPKWHNLCALQTFHPLICKSKWSICSSPCCTLHIAKVWNWFWKCWPRSWRTASTTTWTWTVCAQSGHPFSFAKASTHRPIRKSPVQHWTCLSWMSPMIRAFLVTISNWIICFKWPSWSKDKPKPWWIWFVCWLSSSQSYFTWVLLRQKIVN